MFKSWQVQEFSLVKIIQTDSGAHLACHWMGTGVVSQGSSSQGGRYVDCSPTYSATVIMSGATPLLPPYAFVACTGTNVSSNPDAVYE